MILNCILISSLGSDDQKKIVDEERRLLEIAAKGDVRSSFILRIHKGINIVQDCYVPEKARDVLMRMLCLATVDGGRDFSFCFCFAAKASSGSVKV
jgi:hypothetical protein